MNMVTRQEISLFAFWRDILMVVCALLTLLGGVYLWWSSNVKDGASLVQETKDHITQHDTAINALSAAVTLQSVESTKLKEDVAGIKSSLSAHDDALKGLKDGQKDTQNRIDLLLEHFAIEPPKK
jgi:septal ring factor EnvC (AmiA/AmiB activator)